MYFILKMSYAVITKKKDTAMSLYYQKRYKEVFYESCSHYIDFFGVCHSYVCN